MKLRLAKKIVKAIGTPRESAYTGRQKNLAPPPESKNA